MSKLTPEQIQARIVASRAKKADLLAQQQAKQKEANKAKKAEAIKQQTPDKPYNVFTHIPEDIHEQLGADDGNIQHFPPYNYTYEIGSGKWVYNPDIPKRKDSFSLLPD